jgi:hypothetical protein
MTLLTTKEVRAALAAKEPHDVDVLGRFDAKGRLRL